MQSHSDMRELRGSARDSIPGARAIAPVAPDEVIDVTVRLRPASATAAARVYDRHTARRRGRLAPITREELARRVAASSADARAVAAFAHDAGLTVADVDLPRRTIVLRGSAQALQAAFGTPLQRVDTVDGSFRQRTGPILVPAALSAIVTGVFGLDDRPQASPHFRRRLDAAMVSGVAVRGVSYSPPAMAHVYQFPPQTDGTGQCIAIIELGGGYRSADLVKYFDALPVTAPTVIPMGVDGAQNAPTGSSDGPDGEVVLDIEIAGALAPRATMVVYFAPNTDRGFLDAVTTAVHDTQHAPTVISISWGGPEASWTSQATTALDQALAEAAAIGVPVCAASGDNGASNGVADGELHVDFPASSPHALACGGTHLLIAGGTPTDTVWNELAANNGATGGGFSALFAAPAWQSSAIAPFHQKKRGVPDVSADADPQTGYDVLVDGSAIVVGGTSAVAPLWASLIAQCQQASGRRVADLSARLYAAAGTAFRNVTQGDNGGYSAAVGWDPCTGLGVPIGTALLAAAWGAGSKRKRRAHRKARRPGTTAARPTPKRRHPGK